MHQAQCVALGSASVDPKLKSASRDYVPASAPSQYCSERQKQMQSCIFAAGSHLLADAARHPRIEMHFGRIASFLLLLYLDHCSCTALKDTESLQCKQCTWLQSFTLCRVLLCSALTSLVTGFPQCDYRDGLHQSTSASTRARLRTQGHQQRSTLNEQLCRPNFYSLYPDSN